MLNVEVFLWVIYSVKSNQWWADWYYTDSVFKCS